MFLVEEGLERRHGHAVRRQSARNGPLETLRAANVALFTRIADHPDGTPSADHVAVMLAVVSSSEALRQQAVR